MLDSTKKGLTDVTVILSDCLNRETDCLEVMIDSNAVRADIGDQAVLVWGISKALKARTNIQD